MSVYMMLWFPIAVWPKSNFVADISWEIGFTVISGTARSVQCVMTLRSGIACLGVSLWELQHDVQIGLNDGAVMQFRTACNGAGRGKYLRIRPFPQIYLLQ